MKQYNFIGVVIDARHKSTSYYGNPSYWLTIRTADGKIIEGYTATNAACAYGCKNGLGRTQYNFTAHTTKAGNIIINYMDKVNNQ